MEAAVQIMPKKLHIADGFTLPLDAVTQTFGILGKRGGGKSYTAKVMAEEMISAGAHVCAIDPIGNWWGLRVAADGKSPGLPITVLGGEFGDIPLEATEKAGEFVARLIIEEKLSLVIDLSTFRKYEQINFMIGWAETLYRLNREALHVFIDEADAFAPQRPMGNQAPRLLGAMEDLVRRGRARGLGMTMITQRSASINKDLLTQIEVLIAKRTIAPQDREAVEAWVKVHGTPEQKKTMMDSLATLRNEQAWFWSPSWLDIFKQVHIRKLQTLDSSATPEVGKRRIDPRKLAEVDLESLRIRMAETIERAKQDDPRELRRQIAELKRQFGAKPTEPSAEIMRAEHERGFQAGKKNTAAAFERSFGSFRVNFNQIREAIDAAEEQVRVLGDCIRAWSDSTTSVPTAILGSSNTAAPYIPARNIPRAHIPFDPDAKLASGARRMLAVLAKWYPAAISEGQLRAEAGLRKGGTFDTYKSKLSVLNYLARSGDKFVCTEAGREAIGSDALDVPQNTQDVLAIWKPKLAGGARRILDVLIARGGMTKEALQGASGLSEGGTFDTYISRLRTANLILKEGATFYPNRETLLL